MATNAPISIEPTSPYYIHSSDHPGQTLVTPPFKVGDSFDTWKKSIIIALSAKIKVGFVDGTITKPTSNPQLASFWQRGNDMVTSWIINSLDPTIKQSVIHTGSAKEIWDELLKRFGQTNMVRVLQVLKSLSCVSQDHTDVTSYFTKAKGIWDELCSINSIPRCECGNCSCKSKINDRLDRYEQDQKLVHFLQPISRD